MPVIKRKISINLDADMCLEYATALRQIKVDLESLAKDRKISVSNFVLDFLSLIESDITDALVRQLPEDELKCLVKRKSK
jgi:hypothetical protein